MSTLDRFHVFVYGTLKPGERAYGQLCAPYVQQVETAIAAGRLYHLHQGYPAMTLETGWVQGYRLAFTDQQVLATLDEFEDYFPDRPQESLYERQSHLIYTPDQQPLSAAWLYVMTPAAIAAFSGRWLADGYWSESQI